LSGSAFLLDVNVWLALAFPAHAHHQLALSAYLQATPAQPACFCRATQQGFLRLTTTPAFQHSCNITGFTNRDALNALAQMMASPAVAYREEPSGLEQVWHRLGALNSASPKVWMDAYLAAFAIAGKLQMVTLDQAFLQFAGINVTILAPAGQAQKP
jgi:toxin-antitoxin system PIN domain toxin